MHRKLTFTIAEGPIHWRTHRVMELCEYLTGHVLEPMFKRTGWNWNPRFMNFFTFDNASHPLDPTGTIEFSVPPLLAGQVDWIEVPAPDAIPRRRSGSNGLANRPSARRCARTGAPSTNAAPTAVRNGRSEDPAASTDTAGAELDEAAIR